MTYLPNMAYVASRTRHAGLWRFLREHGAPILSTWIDEAGEGQTADPSELWERVVREVIRSARVVVYADRHDNLTGALVEIGVALGAGIPVVLVGDCPQFHKRCSFAAHPLVQRERDFSSAFAGLEFTPRRRGLRRLVCIGVLRTSSEPVWAGGRAGFFGRIRTRPLRRTPLGKR